MHIVTLLPHVGTALFMLGLVAVFAVAMVSE